MTHSDDFANKLSNLRSNFEELVLGIQEKKIIFFVGAGISFASPTNIETAKELVLKLKDKFENFNWWTEYFDPSKLNAEDRFYNGNPQ